MIIKKRIASFILVALLSAAPWVWAAPVEKCGEPVPLAKLIVSPDAYHGKAVWVVADVTVEFENMTACVPGKPKDRKNCLWLTIDDGPHKTDRDHARYQAKLQTWQGYNLQTVAIRATFDKTSTGHFGMWPGGLRSVTEVLGHEGGWNFSTSAAVPRGACVAKFQLPKQPDDQRAMISGNRKLQNKDIDGAIADFSRAISISPSNSGYYVIRANAKERKRDYDGAIADCTQAIKLSPKDAGGYHCRGLMKQKKGDIKGAEADFARGKQLAP
ncbi:MAG: tetratricopeptide repeat protein [Pseudomonadota bacterium]